MRKLIATKGLPACGKTTWANEEKIRLEKQGLKVHISTKDDIRSALAATGWTWSQEAEKDVIKFQNNDIKSAFAQGKNIVIVADTNFGTHVARLQDLAMHCNADFELKDFTKIALAICLERDARRPKTVGAEVITNMYNKYIAGQQEPEKYVPRLDRPKAIICDLDGTIALKTDRSPFDYSKVDLDTPNLPVIEIVQAYSWYKNYTILYVSGREETCRDLTETWLKKYHLPHDAPHVLLMRKAKDHRNDAIVKLEIFDKYIRDNYNVRFVLDDRDRVVKMWRDIGLTCLQVAYGNF